MGRYRKKLVVVEAWQWDGQAKVGDWPEWAQLAAGQRRLVYYELRGHPRLRIHKLAGPVDACRDHWITCDAEGKLDHNTPADFAATYEKVEEV